jgi:DNA repair protein RecO (recombination protein O)
MEWIDRGLVLSHRPFGESGTIAQLLTREHGRHAGLVRGGSRTRAQVQPGTAVQAVWRARLADHLGNWTLEPERSVVAGLMDDRLRLGALTAACALVEAALPERQPVPAVFDATEALFDALEGDVWDAAYVAWELGLLGALGFGLDLTRCAATGATEDLTHVSPRTGRAVSAEAAAPYRDRLLDLPGFLIGRGAATPGAVVRGLDLTGHFLERWLFAQSHLPVPPARTRHVEAYRTFAAKSGMNAES